MTFPDPDPELDELEQQGKAVFNRACASCHGGPLHPGVTLGFVARPDRLIIHAPADYYLCGSSLSGSEVARAEPRQVHDLPPRKVEVSEHQPQTRVCRRCGAENKADFPAGEKAPVQYGTGVKSVAAYLIGYQLPPYSLPALRC